MTDDREEPKGSELDDLVRAAPGLARIAVGAWWRSVEWGAGTTLRAGTRVLRAAASGESAGELLQETGATARDYARRLLGVVDIDDRLGEGRRAAQARAAANGVPAPAPVSAGELERRSLRDRGEELLRQSADVRYEEAAHPAYERILGELAPDEGRILRFLAMQGAQPAVDVRAGKALNLSSELVAPGLSMIGQGAGARYLERVPAYLNNLFRLGLIWFSREPLSDPLRYQVLEAQPDVLAAMRGRGHGKTVRRSIHLTPFGDDFCRVCLPVHTAELDALPGSRPRE